MSSELHLNATALTTLARDHATRLVRDTQRKVFNHARLSAPVDKGFLRQAHIADPVTPTATGVSTTITVNSTYAMAVHDGTRPHVIRPRHAQALSWTTAGTRIFARSVHHPGTKPNPWLYTALNRIATREGFTVTRDR